MPWTDRSKLEYIVKTSSAYRAKQCQTRIEAERRRHANRRARGEWSRIVSTKTNVEVPFPIAVKSH